MYILNWENKVWHTNIWWDLSLVCNRINTEYYLSAWHQNWKTRNNQRNVNWVTILYKMIHNRVVIDLNLHLVPQLTSYKRWGNVPWYDPTWDVVICYSITKTNYKMIKHTSNLNYIGTSRHREKHNSQLYVVVFS